mmetsp:Transcript_1010/g.1293  ORF Transcript_1010/g.1293 Transcript_1010/m.1293 type:complete len:816 (-) Transcript_1010:223-2670(-)
MVRVFTKGGVWKNSEDEILKAAVMKYGKQQWARVASLLNRKSAKQCKARWHEWLDPSIKKIEWSRAEEEKLLHLAKLMPAQWKTIGPLVGRTASQCQEHYEELLDEAAGGSEARSKKTSLQVGQIDAHPETKPARPDPIDMDEDEMEMLQEARARLANTQGKKAKRKARERLLNQAKRLADLQKRRELKQAGLLSGAARQKAARMRRKDIDLGVEIPFHKPAPAGFHDTSDEAEKTERIRQKRLRSVDYQKVNENQYRTRDREAAMAQKREEARLKALEKSNMQYVVAQVSKQNDPLYTSRKRGLLELPEPQVSDQEHEQLAKLLQKQKDSNDQSIVDGGSNAITQTLLGDYADRPLPTPMRTPQVSSSLHQHSSLMLQASELRNLEQGQTPLLGSHDGTTGAVGNEEKSFVDYKATPKLQPPSADSNNRLSASQTPLRDALGLNDDSNMSVVTDIRDLARQERKAAKRARQELEAALSTLPAPQFEYELATPQDQPMDGDDGESGAFKEDDMADVDAAKLEARRKESERLYEARNSVLKRKDLPRPPPPSFDSNTPSDSAHFLIEKEMVLLLKHDAFAYPMTDASEVKKKKGKKKRKRESSMEVVKLDILPEDYLEKAKAMVEEERTLLIQDKILNAKKNSKYTFEQDVLAVLAVSASFESRKAASSMYFVEEKNQYEDNGNEIEALKTEFQTLREATMSLRKKNDKIANKVGVRNGGYVKRSEILQKEILDTFAQSRNSIIEESVFEILSSMEVDGASARINRLEEELAALESEESKLQKHYGDLLLEKRRLVASANSKQSREEKGLVAAPAN